MISSLVNKLAGKYLLGVEVNESSTLIVVSFLTKRCFVQVH